MAFHLVTPLPAAIAISIGLAAPAQQPAEDKPVDPEVRAAIAQLERATHWRQRNAARDELVAIGAAALPSVLRGTEHQQVGVRRICQEILREHHATAERAVDAILKGLRDADPAIAYASAFHFGPHRIERAMPELRAVVEAEQTDARTRWAAAKSLGELGARDVTVTLWTGLGSDDPYTRYLANLGIEGLCGKDLTDFGYEGPWEGAFVSGPAVATAVGQPIEKAQKRVLKWQAIVAFTKWLKTEKPKLFAELDQKLW